MSKIAAKRELIANRQFLFILFITRTTIVIATLPVLTSSDALQDAWAAAIPTFVGTLALAWLITALGSRFPRQSVIEYSRQLLGRALGAVVSLVILWALLHSVAIELRFYTEMIIGGFLTETPISFLAATMVLAALIAATSGLEVIGRFSDLIFPLFLGALLFTMLIMLPAARMANLQPVLARGLRPVLEGSIVPTAFGAQLLIAAMLIPHLTQPRRAPQSATVVVTGAFFILLAIAALTVATIGPNEGARAVFPFFKAIRGVRIGEFLERIELLVIFAWGFGLFVTLSIFIYSGAEGVAQLLGVKNYRLLILPMALIWTVLSIHDFNDIFALRSFLQPQIFGYYGLFLVLFPFALLWGGYAVARLRGRLPRAGGEDDA